MIRVAPEDETPARRAEREAAAKPKPIQKIPDPPPQVAAILSEMWTAGARLEDIAAAVGRSVGWVSLVARKRLGLPSRYRT